MKNISLHMRISGVSVSDNDVESRRVAANSLAANWGEEDSPKKIVAKVTEIAEALGGDGTPSTALGDAVQTAVQKNAASFLHSERPLEVGVCAGMAMVSILSETPDGSGWLIADIYAAALWSALAFQPVLEDERREKLRREVLNAATDWSAISAEKARQRTEIPEPPDLSIDIGEDNVATIELNDAMADTVEALHTNATLDREELDFLWWALLGRSRLLKKQLSQISEPTRMVAAGIEGARLLRRLPCEVHREIVLRTLDQDLELDLKELLSVIGDDRTTLCTAFNVANVTAYPNVFPLLHALVSGEANVLGSSLKRPVSEWGGRALLEAAFARLMLNGPEQV